VQDRKSRSLSLDLAHRNLPSISYLDDAIDTVLISRGIGLETALQFASEGALLFISDINEPAAHKAAEYITKQYPTSECQSIKCDVSSEKDIKVLVESAVAKWGRLDVMVSPASIVLSE
jgi:NAD(P)-dependent dehydrogenase (short-subunit alcohol dehydrogenase family)